MSLNYIYHVDCLKGRYLEIFSQVELYAEVHGIGEDAMNDGLMNLLDMLSEAQKKEELPEKIVGENLESFCENYFSNYGVKNRMVEFLNKLYSVMWFVFILEMLELIAASGEKGFRLLKHNTDILPYFFGPAILGCMVYILNTIFKKMQFRKKISEKTYKGCILITTLLFSGIVFLLCSWENSPFYYKNEIVPIPTFACVLVSGVYILIYKAVQMAKRYKDNQSFRKPKEMGGFYDTLIESMKKDIAKDFVKKFEKKNEKRVKKGQEKMTREAYIEEIKRMPEKNKQNHKRGGVVLTIFLIGVVIQVAVTSTWYDTLFFSGILAVIEFPILRYIVKENTADKALKELISDCEKQNIDVLEYGERLINDSRK